MPMQVLAHCAQPPRGESEMAAKTMIRMPLTTSFQAVSQLRSAGSQRSRSSVMRVTAVVNSLWSKVPKTNGVVASQRPSNIVNQ